jgi:hypothetical protein
VEIRNGGVICLLTFCLLVSTLWVSRSVHLPFFTHDDNGFNCHRFDSLLAFCMMPFDPECGGWNWLGCMKALTPARIYQEHVRPAALQIAFVSLSRMFNVRLMRVHACPCAG